MNLKYIHRPIIFWILLVLCVYIPILCSMAYFSHLASIANERETQRVKDCEERSLRDGEIYVMMKERMTIDELIRLGQEFDMELASEQYGAAISGDSAYYWAIQSEADLILSLKGDTRIKEVVSITDLCVQAVNL